LSIFDPLESDGLDLLKASVQPKVDLDPVGITGGNEENSEMPDFV
jgi:hypothetical protein